MHKCASCKAPITYVKDEVFCSSCGRKNYKYLTALGEGHIEDKIKARLKALFINDPEYLYFIMDNYNGVGEIYRHVVRLKVKHIEFTHWSSDDEVVIKFKSTGINITKNVTKKGTTGFDVSTSKFSQCRIGIKELLKDVPTDDVNMQHTSSQVLSNVRRGILNEASGLYFKETTKAEFDKYMDARKAIENILEIVFKKIKD